MKYLPILVLLAAAAACSGGGGGDPPVVILPPAAPQLGGPNPGLSEPQLAMFERGRAVFVRRFTRTDGHGPDFNTSSCRSCHEIPVAGGSSPLYRNFILAARDDGTTFVGAFAGNQLVARTFSYTRTMREAVPTDANVVAQRNAPPMFGMGLLVNLASVDIQANQDPLDGDGDGISGRVNFDGTRVGRLGYKAQESGVEDFVRGPIFNHMGITTNPLSFGPTLTQVGSTDQPTTDNDGVPDPELSFDDLRDLVFFTEQLAPPMPLPPTPETERGAQVFNTVQCAKCHIPNLRQSGDPILAYTDLLLHDMGPDLADGIRMGFATGSEFRTQPLWGLRFHAPYLHDGRAGTIEEAILMHAGEAMTSRNEFAALNGADRAALLAFLETR